VVSAGVREVVDGIVGGGTGVLVLAGRGDDGCELLSATITTNPSTTARRAAAAVSNPA
jgi:hypothetical protein